MKIDIEEHYIMIKGSIQEEDITIIHTHTHTHTGAHLLVANLGSIRDEDEL